MFEIGCKSHCHHQFLIFILPQSRNLQFQSSTSKYTNLGVYPVSYIVRKVKSVIFAKYHIFLQR